MNIPSVSFGGARARYERFEKVGDATAAKLAAVIDAAHKKMEVQPARPPSVERFLRANPGCFDRKTGKLNQKGLDGFDRLYKHINLSRDSRLYESQAAIEKYLEADVPYGTASKIFDYVI